MATIKHHKFDDKGNLIGTFDLNVESNETETDIYITPKLLKQLKNDMKNGCSSDSHYSGYDKDVWYKADGKDPVRITDMTLKKRGEKLDVTFVRLDGKKIEMVL